MKYDQLTPTERLILEVLAARWRLGDDDCFTFATDVLKQLRKLEKLGLIWWKHGVIEKTALVGLKTAGMDMVFSPNYNGKGRPYARSKATQ